MTITYELDLNNFQAWSGAKETLERIQREGKCSLLEQILEDIYPDGMTETECAERLGIKRSAVHYHKQKALESLRVLMSEN